MELRTKQKQLEQARRQLTPSRFSFSEVSPEQEATLRAVQGEVARIEKRKERIKFLLRKNSE